MTAAEERFDRALEAFKAAASELAAAWVPGIEVEDYPRYLPSFDELTAELAGVERAPAECLGHPAEDCGAMGEHAAIGEVLYCDGSCR